MDRLTYCIFFEVLECAYIVIEVNSGTSTHGCGYYWGMLAQAENHTIGLRHKDGMKRL
jgi:hypothetical protein